jgi:hypothetical protein
MSLQVLLLADLLRSCKGQRVHRDVIVRIRRVLKRSDLDPIALGLQARPRR